MDYSPLLAHLEALRPAMLEALRELVEHESPTTEKAAVDRLGRRLVERFREAGAEVAAIANETRGDHVLASFPAATADAPPALLLGHFDTVWPLGTLAERPFRVEGGRALGPGSYDMKAGIVVAEFALRTLRDLGLTPPRPVVLLLNSDEEVGSTTSRAIIEEKARQARYVLVLEPANPDGSLKTARKGVGRFTVAIEGRAAHAGVEPEKGISAIQEMAHQVLRLHALNDLTAGTTVNVGVARGGTRSNVVADRAEMEIDVRVWTQTEARRIEAAITGAGPVLPGALLRASGRFTRPPMEPTAATAEMFQRAREIASALGLDLQAASSGGGSDGNFTAALGVPTLDGVGGIGAGAHAAHEYVEIDSLPARAALVAALLLDL